MLYVTVAISSARSAEKNVIISACFAWKLNQYRWDWGGAAGGAAEGGKSKEDGQNQRTTHRGSGK